MIVKTNSVENEIQTKDSVEFFLHYLYFWKKGNCSKKLSFNKGKEQHFPCECRVFSTLVREMLLGKKGILYKSI
jgi:hypothetical protein